MIDLTLIKEDMTVYDENNNKIGTVDYVEFGDEDPNHPGAETATTTQGEYDNSHDLFRAFAKALVDDHDHVPEEIRDRLERYGYMRLDTGNLFESDYYVPLSMVTTVADGNVHIQTTKEDLVSA